MRYMEFAIPLLLSVSCLPDMAHGQPAASRLEGISLAELSNFTKKPQEVRDSVDEALMEAPNSVPLNFLSGLVYDAQSTAGSEGRDLARVGYLSALRADPTYWPANFQLGLLAMEDADAVSAERLFTGAAFHAPDEPAIFYALARASYCAGDYANAKAALERAIFLAQPVQDEELLTATLVLAANGDRTAAGSWLTAYEMRSAGRSSIYLRNRIAQLLDGYVSPPLVVERRDLSATPIAAAPQPHEITNHRRMATVDVVIIRRKEVAAKTSGINLMDALTFQFGSTLVNSERVRTTDRLAIADVSDLVVTTNNINLTVPTVTYSLNIANSSGSQSSIEARPTLLVYDGQTSKVFSGGTLTYAASGQLSSQSFTKEVGTSLSVTPKFNDDNKTVTLTISTGLETFVNEPAVGSFNEAVQTDKSSTEITAELRFGDTVIMSGGRFKNLEANGSAVPVLSAIPILGNLFRTKKNVYVANDLLILLSLRRESGGADSGSAEEIERVIMLQDRLWRKLDIPPPEHSNRTQQEDHRPFYILANPGRAFSKLYLLKAGLNDVFF